MRCERGWFRKLRVYLICGLVVLLLGCEGDSGGCGSTATDTDTDSVCIIADEGDEAVLACPTGQFIDAIDFASYGTPDGSCGNLVAGACHADMSRATVEELCVGRQQCTVAAANTVFGDPCNGVVKRLAVAASCAIGTPVIAPLPYKGVANSPCDTRIKLGVTWYYNWGGDEAEPCADPTQGGEFVPMIWGWQSTNAICGAVAGFANQGRTHVLGFNEPDHTDQANMSVDTAIALLPAFDQEGIELVSPAAASDGRWWAEDFMGRVADQSLRVDVFATHWYGWNTGSCDASAAGLESHINWAEGVAGSRPIWLTEWGCLNQSAPDEATVVAFFKAALVVFARHPRVQRYAWYPWSTNCHLVASDGSLTALGKAFADATAYR